MSNPEETVTISKSRYDSLLDAERWVECLNAAGVDNWEGYAMAQEMCSDSDEDNEDEE